MIALGCYASAGPVSTPLLARMKTLAKGSRYASAILDQDGPFTFATAAHDHRRVNTPRGRLIHILGHAYDLGPPEHLDALLDAGRHLELTQLSGNYVLVIWEPHSRTLSLMSDSLSSIPFYYARHGRDLLWGTSPRDFATDPSFRVEPSIEGIVSFLELGCVIGDATLAQGISALRPREWLMFEGGRMRRTARPLVFTKARWHVPPGPLVDEFHEVLSSIVARQVASHSKVNLLLSGGLDSRGLAGLLAGRVQLRTLTYGRWYLREVQLARRVARSLGVENLVVRYDPAFLAKHGREFSKAVGGQCDALHAFWRPLSEQVPSGVPLVIGYFLGVLYGQCLRYGGDAADHKTAVSAWLQHFSSGLFTADDLCSLLRPSFADVARAYTLRTICDIGDRYEYPFQAIFAIHLERQHRLISLLPGLFRERTSVLLPGTDRLLLEFVCSLAPMALDREHLYRQLLRRYYPALARIAYANDGLPPEPNLREQTSAYLNSLVRRWLAPLAPARLQRGRNIVASLAHLDSSTSGLWALLPELESGLDLISEHVRPEAVRLLISRFRRDGTGGERLRALLSLVWYFRALRDVAASHYQQESDYIAARTA
ncbi:MAG: asparagine synthase-related protein [Candidatus Rokuibacteriota bacterium]